jgi:GxxExxY protein
VTQREPISEHLDAVARAIVDSAFHVHTGLGPGLLESVYEACLAHELEKRGMPARRQVVLPVVYDGVRIDAGLRLDMIVENVVVEVKAVERLIAIHQAQLLTYLKLSGYRLGLLINFNVLRIKEGIRRIAL